MQCRWLLGKHPMPHRQTPYECRPPGTQTGSGGSHPSCNAVRPVKGAQLRADIHLVVEHLGFAGISGGDEVGIQDGEDILADLGELALNLLAVLLDEANAIGTTYLRAGMLPDRRDAIRALLRDYVETWVDGVLPIGLRDI